jgi:hypothetical protein
MKCEVALDLIEDQAGTPLSKEFQLHLVECPSCSEAFRAFQACIENFQDLPSMDVPQDFVMETMIGA